MDRPVVDLEQPPPFPLSDIIITSIDFEGSCKRRKHLVEIGCSYLDLRDVQGLAPGDRGVNWLKKIKSKHFVIQNAHHPPPHPPYCKSQYPQNFLYGASTYINSDNINRTLIE